MATSDPRVQRVLATVEAIPRGRVATYGQVADEAGLPRRARFVGRVLRVEPVDDLPWHRVVGSGGWIKTRGRSAREQTRRLKAEGVKLRQGRVVLSAHAWQPEEN